MKFDVTTIIEATTREVTSREHAGRAARVVRVSRTYDTSIADLWDAVTNAERIPRWFLPVSGDLRLGGRYQLVGNASGTITGCEPPRRLALTWEFGGDTSWVEVYLSEESEERTRLSLEHIAHVGDDRWNEYGPGAVGVGWDLGLLGLGAHVSSGGSADPQEVMAWSASAEGKEFITRSSAGWEQASIAAGTEPLAATAAAARTTAFYTGEGAPEH